MNQTATLTDDQLRQALILVEEMDGASGVRSFARANNLDLNVCRDLLDEELRGRRRSSFPRHERDR
jgi:hypothetical protein